MQSQDSLEISKTEDAGVPVLEKRVTPSNPNELFGQALKTTGGVALSIGVPALVSGTILVALAYSPSHQFNTNETYLRCGIAGYILMPIGASLTIIGIPLYAHGKRIAEMTFNYTGNGASIAMNF